MLLIKQRLVRNFLICFITLNKKSEVLAIAKKYVTFALLKRGNSSVGRALASQAEGRGFEPRLPLIFSFYFGSCKILDCTTLLKRTSLLAYIDVKGLVLFDYRYIYYSFGAAIFRKICLLKRCSASIMRSTFCSQMAFDILS